MSIITTWMMPLQNPDWTMARSGVSSVLAQAGESSGYPASGFPAVERWHFAAGGYINMSFVVANNVMYIPSAEAGILYGIDVSTGKEVWQVEGYGGDGLLTESNGVVFFAGGEGDVYAFDAITTELIWQYAGRYGYMKSMVVVDGSVYVGDEENVYALDAESGLEKWRFARPDLFGMDLLVVSGVVYIGSPDTDRGYDILFAVDGTSGVEKWRFIVEGGISRPPALVNDTLILGEFYGGNIYAIDAVSGAERWRFQTGGAVASTPIAVNGVIYAELILEGSVGSLLAIDAIQGKEIWHFDKGDYVIFEPTVIDGVVYTGGGEDGNVYAIDATSGSELWRFPTYGNVSTKITVAGGVVYSGNGNNQLYAINAANGEGIWNFVMGNFVSTPAVVVDGEVYVASGDENYYAIESPSPEIISLDLAMITSPMLNERYAVTALGQGHDFEVADPNPLPLGSSLYRRYSLNNSVAESGIYVSLYDLIQNADQAAASAIQVLKQLGWTEFEAPDLDHIRTCLMWVGTTSQAVCYVQRDTAIVTTYTYLYLDPEDISIATDQAANLAIAANTAFDSVPALRQ